MMGLFAYVYYSSLIRVRQITATVQQLRLPKVLFNLTQVHHVNVGTVIHTIVNSLSVQEQLEVYRDLRKYLNGQGISTA